MDFIEIYLTIMMFIIGTLFGSFFSLANYRIPRKKDIVFTRSFCPKCNHNLGFFDLIPVLSYIFHGGRCKYCKDKISPRYILLEICSGLFFMTSYLVFHLSVYMFISIILYIYLVMLTGCYLNKQKLLKEEMDKINMENHLRNNSGVFITEIVVAAVIFAIAVTSIYFSYTSTINSKVEDIYNNNVMMECTKNVEVALGLNYDDLTSFSSTTIINGISYSTVVEVEKYSNSASKKEDYIKIIKANTKCVSSGKMYSYDIETMKKRVDR